MSMDDLFGRKPLRNTWLSQFGLYRYESAAPERRAHTNATCRYFIIISITSLILLILLVFINYTTNGDPPKRLVYVNNSHHPPLTTVFYPEQIGAYKNYLGGPDQYSTTPTNFKLNKTDFLLDANLESPSIEENRITSMQLRSDESFSSPSNHRPFYTEGRLHAYTPNSVRPSGFRTRNVATTAAAYPQIPKDYVGSVNSIGEILDQVHGQAMYPHKDQSMAASMIPTVTGGLSVRVQGTYRQKKVNGAQSEQPIDSIGVHSNKNPRHVASGAIKTSALISDPFYPYKPASLSDINLMATKQFRFAPFVHHARVKPMNMAPQLSEAETVYHQILAASANRQAPQADISRREPADRKPFSLMLDVYPVNDDEVVPTTKKPRPNKFKRPLPPPMDVNLLNNNLQYDQSYYNLLKFPQLQPYRMPNMHHVHDDTYFRRYLALQQNPWWQKASAVPQQQPQSSERHEQLQSLSNENQPSQITVHLNLYPGRKSKASKSKVTSIEVLGRSDEDTTRLFAPNIDHSHEAVGIRNPRYRNDSIGIPYLANFLPSPLIRAPNVTTESTTMAGTQHEVTTETIAISDVKAEMPTNFAYAHATLSVPVTTASTAGPANSSSATYAYNNVYSLHQDAIGEIATADVQPTHTLASTEVRRPAVYNNIISPDAFEPIIMPTPYQNVGKVTTTPTSFDGPALVERPANRTPRYRNLLYPARR